MINDRLMKYAYLIPYKEASNVKELVYVFLKTVPAQHRTLKEIISDRDKLFTSKF